MYEFLRISRMKRVKEKRLGRRQKIDFSHQFMEKEYSSGLPQLSSHLLSRANTGFYPGGGGETDLGGNPKFFALRAKIFVFAF